MMRRKIFLILILFFLSVPAASAQAEQPFSVEDFSLRPIDDADDFYSDLIRKTFPEVVYDPERQEAIIRKSFELRKLSSEERTPYAAPLVVLSAEGWWFATGP